MELPRNITQVGETDRNCKIYVEDYVVSYMKQMNKFAEEKEITVALYGKMSMEQQITYCFVYGACMVQSISREVRHLSQAQNQEVERMRRKYFPEQTFLGYQILNGEMIEGFRIYDQNSCRYVKGYACFFEKNDTMLAYMLEARSEEVQPERVDQDKYDMVKKRQEDRRQQFEERRLPKRRIVQEPEKSENKKAYQFKVVPFVALAGCCLVALVLWDRGNTLDDVKQRMSVFAGTVKDVLFDQEEKEGSNEVFLIESEEVQKESEEVQAVMGTLVTEDKLVEAILEENQKADETEQAIPEQEGDLKQESEQQKTEQQEPEQQENEQQENEQQENEQQENEQQENEMQENEKPESETPTEETKQPQSYTIKAGDTLIAISTRLYGNDSKVSQICDLNNISNPDNIQIGQKILLP